MLAEITCPFCNATYGADIVVNTRSTVDDHGEIRTSRRILDIRQLENFEDRVLEAMNPFVVEGTTLEYVERVLQEEFHVCKAHLPRLTERIREVYGLYCPDGKRFKKI